MQISSEETGLLGVKQTPEVAAKVTELLQLDLEVRYHDVTNPYASR